jgi:hypothetical protein
VQNSINILHDRGAVTLRFKTLVTVTKVAYLGTPKDTCAVY